MMNRKKQSGFVGIAFLLVSLGMVGLVGLVGNHPPRKDADQKVDVCKMNGTCTENQYANNQ